ncbi:hypothetical protein [Streptomyces sp. NPDC093223]|uniref:hypothetical protein n=1 Tax=Streptomyces sp. NPDC093223 TaxID=3366033 RepID=UPI0038145638
MTTATRTPQLVPCTCGCGSEPHMVPVQRILVTGSAQVHPEVIRDALEEFWYDATLFYGPGVVLSVAYEGEAIGAAEVACEWADARGFAVEPYAGEFIAARLTPEGAGQAPGGGCPVYRYAA